jgi:hypothetical protein
MTWRQHILKLHLTWRSHFRRSLSLPLTQVSGRYCPLSEDSYRIPLPGAPFTLQYVLPA